MSSVRKSLQQKLHRKSCKHERARLLKADALLWASVFELGRLVKRLDAMDEGARHPHDEPFLEYIAELARELALKGQVVKELADQYRADDPPAKSGVRVKY